MDKNEKKSFINGFLNLGDNEFTDEEVDKLYEIVSNPGAYDGMVKTKEAQVTNWYFGDAFSHKEKTTYTLHVGEDGVYIDEYYSYRTDTGKFGAHTLRHEDAREFINMFGMVFG